MKLYMASDITYKIKLKIGQNEIEFHGDKDWVEAKLEEFQSILQTTQVQPTSTIQPSTLPIIPLPVQSTATSLPDSIREFHTQKGSPSKHTDTAMIIAYWLEKYRGTPSYNYVDIENAYGEALISKPSNTSDVMNSNQKKGYLIPAGDKDGKKAWRLSKSGEEYIEQMK